MRRSAETEVNKVLAGAVRGAGNKGKFEGFVGVEGGEETGETVGVGGEGLGWSGKWVFVK